jgi:capsular exopolysaccharide synthesis family protein
MRVVDHARVLDKPTRPRRGLSLALGLVAALIGGVMLAFIREQFDPRVHTLEDVQKSTGLSASCVVPVIAGTASSSSPAHMLAPFLLRRKEQLGNGMAEEFVLKRPDSLEAEALRGLRTSVMLSRRGRVPQAILVTSSLPAEGKTTIAVNLAVALAQYGRTCLVDADLRRGGATKAFALRSTTGLAAVLAGSTSIDEALVNIPHVPRLAVLPAGSANLHPAELMAPEQMRGVLQFLRHRFASIIIDSSPILAHAEGRAIAALVDGVVLIGRSGVITREALARTLALLAEVGAAPIVDVVLNAADLDITGYAYYAEPGGA